MQIHKNSLQGNFNVYREWWQRMLFANPSDENKDSVKKLFSSLFETQLIEISFSTMIFVRSKERDGEIVIH